MQSDEQFQLLHSLWQAYFLPKPLQEKLVRWGRVFQSEKYWEGCEGLSISPEMKRKIAYSVGLMVLGHDDWYFENTATVLVYPRPYVAKVPPHMSGSMVGGEFARAGETVYRGPVVLNWNDVQMATRDTNDGDHLVIHEFAHQLDFINGVRADGIPPLPKEIDDKAWRSQFQAEFDVAREMVAEGHRILMDDYGLSELSEFFARGSELYFQSPYDLAQYHPNVFKLLNEFYRMDLRQFLPNPPR